MASFDMHEFNVIDSGRRALVITTALQRRGFSNLALAEGQDIIMSNGFQEIDMDTGAAIFEWNSSKNGVSPHESTFLESRIASPDYVPDPWDYLHMNSVDQMLNGDYLISGRHTDCIYRISGIDGTIIWRLGGLRSSFVLDFNFSRQHDARVRHENSSVTIISFLDNASDGISNSSAYSSALLVALYNTTLPMTAKLLRRWKRPDSGHTTGRGNVQLINDNVVVNWSDEGYLTEYAYDGRIILEAGYESSRFKNYRAYKFDWNGSPREAPALKIYSHTSVNAIDQYVSVFYVSWNGATAVAGWNFYGSQSSHDFTMLGHVQRTGFETTFVSHCMQWGYAEAFTANGTILGKSEIQQAITPRNFIGHCIPQVQAGKPDSSTSGSRAEQRPNIREYVPIMVLAGVVLLISVAFAVLWCL